MFGKTLFSRIFFINIITVLVCIIVLGSLQMVLMTNYIARQSEESLAKSAESIVTLIKNSVPAENLSVYLSGFAHSSDKHIIILNSRSGVIINTEASGFFARDQLSFVPNEYSKVVLSGQKNTIIGTMGGIFNQTMFTLQLPILDENGGGVLGAVFISMPIPEQQKMTNELFRVLSFSAIMVCIISFLLSYMLSRRLSTPISKIRTSAVEFAKGNLEARVDLGKSDAETVEIKELGDTFNEMAAELEKAEETRMAFISDVSHELRTPMTTISGFVYGILDDTIPPEKQKEYLTIVHSEITRLSRLVNTFLDITRLNSDKMVIHQTNFDINETIRMVIISLEKKLEDKKIDVDLKFSDQYCYVRADSDSIKRVLTNLLDNAVKFTYPEGKITVTVTPKQQEVYISVHNTGCGIPEEQQRMIFERLYKVDKSRSENKEGTGIGLYLVKQIIRAHGKNIIVNSKEGEYAEFVFNLSTGRRPDKREKTEQK